MDQVESGPLKDNVRDQSSLYDLAVVMPVYNEAVCIVRVLESWLALLEKTVKAFKIIVINDGSRDNTASSLAAFADDPRIEVINQANAGHGPAILRGYRQAVVMAGWVFQVDSDDELKAADFPPFWERRAGYDALFGFRFDRHQPLGRKVVSFISRAVVFSFFGRVVKDVNVPYRLLRASLLAKILPSLAANTFAPNLLIAAACSRLGVRVANLPVSYESRKTAAVSFLGRWQLWSSCLKAFWQTMHWACRPIGLK